MDDGLFPGIDLGDRLECGDGCARPIGRRPTGRKPRPRPVRARRTTLLMFGELRSELGTVMVSIRRIERAIGAQGARRANDSELLKLLVRR